ncbi:MAG: 1,4-dihydroxy-6-naphthoate synthase [Bacteroidales bacterium]|nr:1,4-dihydroxy-6-naphthoate synthase [Bacteroidales bacterium]
MKLTLGFSPCPNDTFIFDALVNKKIDAGEFEFKTIIEDVEQLNQKVIENEPDISKISFAVYPQISSAYKILSSGCALGINNGPLIISKKKIYPDEIPDVKIAIPGTHTTANLLLSIAYPRAKKKFEYLFSDIEDAILANEVDAGVIIHETRFTYQKKGLLKILDLGEFWQKATNGPLPLGGIVIRRSVNINTQRSVELLIKKSVQFALQKPISSLPFIKNYSAELDEDIISQHISLYVNEYSADMGKAGQEAIVRLFKEGSQAGCFTMPENDIFVSEIS